MFYFVPVPIGNMEDITLRAIRLFEEADVVLVEDGRFTSKLFDKLLIKNEPRFINIIRNQSTNLRQIEEAVNLYERNAGKLTVLVVSDAGTPGLSDPGFEIVRMLQEKGLEYSVLPGANALVPAVVASGLVGKDFTFHGFLPLKKGRQTLLHKISESEIPIVFYESVHRIRKTLIQLQDLMEPTRKIFIARELSKQFEEYISSELGSIDTESITEKGEFVVVIDKK